MTDRPALPADAASVDLPPAVRAAIEEHLTALTPTQQRRIRGILVGKSPADLARDEGISKQAMSESLNAAAVRSRLGVILAHATVTRGEKKVDLVVELLNHVASLALSATRPVVVGGGDGRGSIEMVPDHGLQSSIAFRLLGILDRPAASSPKTPPGAQKGHTHELEAEETVTTTRRRVRARATKQ